MEPREYQQMMYNFLGNRDYDSFESDELDSLKSKIGYALYGHPQKEDGYESEQNTSIDKLFNVILTQTNLFSKHKDRVVISFIYNCTEPLEYEKKRRATKFADYNPKIDMHAHPVFILRKCKYSPFSCRVIIDEFGRVYSSWDEYLRRNTLPKCLMIYPKNGRYSGDENGKVILDTSMSPAKKLRASLISGFDIASTGLGIGSAGIALAASVPAITVVGPTAACGAGMAGIGVGIYSLGRSLGTLYDKRRHKENLSFSDSIARAAYLNVIAGAMGFVGAGANIAVSQLASQGVTIGREASLLATTINAANIGTSGLAVLNSGYDVLHPWMTQGRNPSLLTLVQLSSSILFFGHAVYNFKSARTIIDETQMKVLEEVQKTLKENRLRRAFKKLQTETIRKHKGHIQKGNAEVIATMRKIVDRNQLFEFLSKSDADPEGFGTRYVANNGGITTFSGVPVDLGYINGLSHGNFDKYSIVSTNSSTVTPHYINEIKNNIANSLRLLGLEGGGVSKLSNYFVGVTGCLSSISVAIFGFMKEFVQQCLIQDEVLFKALDELFPHSEEKALQVINAVTGFVYGEAKKIEKRFNASWIHENVIFKSLFEYAKEKHLKEYERLKYFIDFICNTYNDEGRVSEQSIDGLKKYFASLMAEQMLLRREKRARKENRQKLVRNVERRKCQKCSGLYYDVIV